MANEWTGSYCLAGSVPATQRAPIAGQDTIAPTRSSHVHQSFSHVTHAVPYISPTESQHVTSLFILPVSMQVSVLAGIFLVPLRQVSGQWHHSPCAPAGSQLRWLSWVTPALSGMNLGTWNTRHPGEWAAREASLALQLAKLQARDPTPPPTPHKHRPHSPLQMTARNTPGVRYKAQVGPEWW